MIKIWRPKYVAFAANILLGAIRSLGYRVCIVDEIDPSDTSLYIIYTAARVKRLPPNYIVYQTEVAKSGWFTSGYLKAISGAQAVWEYDASNIEAYQYLNNNISIVSPGFRPQAAVKKDIPFLFYGYVQKSLRRQELLIEIGRALNLVIIENKLATDMWQLLSRAKVVVNLHFYQNAPLETFRINEALSFGCRVVSQKCPTIDHRYKRMVSFADSVEELIYLMKAEVASEKPLDCSWLNNGAQVERAMRRIYPLPIHNVVHKLQA